MAADPPKDPFDDIGDLTSASGARRRDRRRGLGILQEDRRFDACEDRRALERVTRGERPTELVDETIAIHGRGFEQKLRGAVGDVPGPVVGLLRRQRRRVGVDARFA